MRSSLNTIICAVGILLLSTAIEAAPLHGDYRESPSQSSIEWFSVLHHRQNVENPIAYASEKFRSIPQGKIVSLTFEEQENDPLGLFSTGLSGNTGRFENKWIELLFGLRSWEFEEDSRYNPISSQSTSAIPLPAGFFLFISGLGGMFLVGWLKKRGKQTIQSV
jgi:hypothetical protein